jgi:hypothetical protein
MTNPAYVLGHSSFELERLARQDRLIGPMTREYFQEAGIAQDMRVLDVGSGTASHPAEGWEHHVLGTN